MVRSVRVRGLWQLAAAAVCVLGALFLVAALYPERTAGPCSVTAGPTLMRDVPEASGLAVSRRRPGLIWTHNDSGNDTVLFALDESGTIQGRVRLPIRTRDWEDLSAAPCPAGQCLYVADIGDNSLERRSVVVYRVAEPEPDAARTGRPDMFTVTYPDGPHNAEALFVIGDYLFIVTRDRTGAVYRSTSPLASGVAVKLEHVVDLGLVGVTDAEASADGRLVAIRTSDDVAIYQIADLVGGTAAPKGTRIPIEGLREPQGEAVAIGKNGTLYLASEGRRWNPAGRFIRVRCPSHM
jgi:hypothetical protein